MTKYFYLFFLAALLPSLARAEFFSVASYNLENYIDSPASGRPAKSPESKAKIREALRLINADVVALQEVGGTNALLELQRSLLQEGLAYPFLDCVAGHDTNIHVAVLSRLPILSRKAHAQDMFVLRGRRFQVTRGFEELRLRVTPGYEFTLLNAHLKSRRPIPEADEAELREEEARILRQKADAVLQAETNARLIVLGDFNEIPTAASTRIILGRNRLALIDTRPSERNGDSAPNPLPQYAPRTILWTHYYGKEETYSRSDYIFISKTMAREWVKSGTYVLAFQNWGLASDHRPIVARFSTTP